MTNSGGVRAALMRCPEAPIELRHAAAERLQVDRWGSGMVTYKYLARRTGNLHRAISSISDTHLQS